MTAERKMKKDDRNDREKATIEIDGGRKEKEGRKKERQRR